MFINLMKSIELYKEKFLDCNEGIDKFIIIVEIFIIIYLIIEKVIKIGKDIESRKIC